MLKFDLVFVTYNSSKWVKNCFDALQHIEFPKKDLNIIVVDNNSSDSTLEKLNRIQIECEFQFASFQIIPLTINNGFGIANNIGFAAGSSDIVCFLNIDTELFVDTLTALEKAITESKTDYAIWELRQIPFEHPKLYDPVTLETTWSSGAAFAVQRKVYSTVGGFDKHIFMYAEDVDLSWRIRSFGYQCMYVPKARIIHHSYENAGQTKPVQYINSIINNLLLRHRFGNKKAVITGELLFWNIFRFPEPFPGSKKELRKAYGKYLSLLRYFQHGSNCGHSVKFKPEFLGFDYSINRDGAFYFNEEPVEKPLVSILVRTCGRPEILRETLISISNQTYSNIETVIVEDGPNVSQKMIETEFPELNVVYWSSGEKIGRSRAGNKAMELAHGKYLNFLDDDDVFYSDHVEVIVNTLNKNKDCRAAYAFAFETPIEVLSKSPYKYVVKSYKKVYKQKFDRMVLFHHNYIPIQCIAFEKSLFEQYGGMDETVDALEDWDLWVRYSLHTDFACAEKTTSLYRVPYQTEINAKRQKDLDDALIVMRKKHMSYHIELSVSDIARLYEHR